MHHIDAVTKSVLKYLANGQVCFKVYGYPDFEMARKNNKKEIEESKKEEVKKDTAKVATQSKVESKWLYSNGVCRGYDKGRRDSAKT